MNKNHKAFRGSADPWSFRGYLQAQASQGVGTRAVMAWRSILFLRSDVQSYARERINSRP